MHIKLIFPHIYIYNILGIDWAQIIRRTLYISQSYKAFKFENFENLFVYVGPTKYSGMHGSGKIS